MTKPVSWCAAIYVVVPAWIILWSASVVAEQPACPSITSPASLRPSTPDTKLPAEISAREARTISDGLTEFSGNVELQRGGEKINADHLIFDRSADEALASGNVILNTGAGDRFETPEAQMKLGPHVGHTGAATFSLGLTQGRGDAERIDFEGRELTRLTKTRFTTCAPGQDDWFLKASRLDLDTATDTGTARHSTVSFFGVPIFYWPYLSFPISDRRRSGFLIPQFGYSDKLGGEIEVPYYWNIAPNYDATFTPRWIGRHGVQLRNEFRYLGRHSAGKLDIEFLPDDRVTEDNRAAGSYTHRHSLSPLWSALIDVRRVSDEEYLDDFGGPVADTAVTHLPQTAEINYRGKIWQFAAVASDFQTIDPTISTAARPYARLPQLSLNASPPGETNRPRVGLDGEWVSFQHETNIEGGRLNLQPTVSWPLANSYSFVTPKLGAYHISYRLDNAAPTADTSPGVTRGIFSLDSGLFFERDTAWGSRPYVQTLEPRLFYVYIPFADQDQLPVFDSGLPDFSFTNLFRENRFIGGDRIGDANQATLALTTRLLDDTDGTERFRASIGQTFYYDDRRVNIPAGTDTSQESDIAGEISARLIGNWHVSASVQWNEDDRKIQKGSFYLQHQPARDRIVNLGYRFVRDDLEQTDVSLEWPLGGRWALRGRSLHSLSDHRNLESYAGLEYKTCCWALRVFADRRVSQTSEQVRSVNLQLELNGLSRLGGAPDSPLAQGLFSSF